LTQNGILGTIETDRGGTMSDSRIDLDAIDAAALRDGTIPAQQAHALVAIPGGIVEPYVVAPTGERWQGPALMGLAVPIGPAPSNWIAPPRAFWD